MSEKIFWEKTKKFFKGFWNLLWKDNSIKGWAFSIIFLFVFVKFVFLPLLGLVTGTSLPLAIVESCSMYHQGNIFSNYNSWWESHSSKYTGLGFNKTEFSSFIFGNGFSKGDILFIVKANPAKLEIGDIILFNAQQTNPVIHRIIGIQKQGSEYIFSTIGDNNNAQLSFEKNISEEQIVGKAQFRIVPYLGWIKLIFFEALKPESERGFCKQQ